MLDTMDSVTVITGRARFLDDKSVEVSAGADRLVVSATTIVINTGAEPVVPDIPGLRSSAYMRDSTDLIRSTDLPARMVVLGAGLPGMEFAWMYRGSARRSRCWRPGRGSCRRRGRRRGGGHSGHSAGRGRRVRRGRPRHATSRDGRRACDRASTEVADEEHASTPTPCSPQPAASPRLDDLGLEAAGVRTTATGAIEVDEHLRTSQPHIYAIGDVKGGPQFTYISLDDSRIVADQLLGSGTRSTVDRKSVPYTLFMTPPLSRVGLTEQEARERGHGADRREAGGTRSPRCPAPKILGETRGMMKFVIDTDHRPDPRRGPAERRLAGADQHGRAGHAARRHCERLRDTIYTHPSSTEAFNEVLAAAHP